MKSPIERVLSRVLVDQATGCHVFLGAKTAGYGVIGAGGRGAGNLYAHRVAYEHFVGPIPEGLHIDHLCRVRACVNPTHLEAVTQAENNRRAHAANRRTHCKRGHEFTPENTQPNSRGGRRCRTCHRANTRERRLAQKESA